MVKLLFASWDAENKEEYPYQNWYLPLKRIFGDIKLFDPRIEYLRYGKEEMNKRFLMIVEKEKPDYIFFCLIYDEFYLETLKSIKRLSPNTKTINFFADDELRFDEFSRHLSLFFDICITTYPQAYKKAKKLGLKNFYLVIYGCNTSTFKKLKMKKIYDVGFIGKPASQERKEMIKFLINSGIEVNIWGKGWTELEDFEEYRDHYHGIAENIVKITNECKIMLTFLKDDGDSKIQIKGRLAEVAGCGTFQIITENKETTFMLKNGKEGV